MRSRAGRHTGRFTDAAALALAGAVLAGPANAGPTLGDRLGEWGGTWPKIDIRNEVRIEAATPKAITGTFCSVRAGDGSVFFYDFDQAKTKVKAASAKMKRKAQTHGLEATSDGLELTYQRKGKKRHRLALAQGEMRCIGRITPVGSDAAAAENAPPGGGLAGTWTAYDDKGHATEVRIAGDTGEAAVGTLCFVRKDEATVYFDFAPGARIAAAGGAGRVEIERKPFKKAMRHVLTMTGGDVLTYEESVGKKPPRLTLEMRRGAAADGCLRRVEPAKG